MPDAAKPKILCVDDEKDIVDSLYDTFMDYYDVKIACSGEEALKIFEEEEIAVVITDQRMPNMEGTELLARINEKKPYCKKILLTGYADINAAIDAINKGSVDKYFSKPWDDEALMDAVKHLASMYDFDKFLDKMKQDGEILKSGARAGETFEKFLNAYSKGVCIVGKDNDIAFVNKQGLEIMHYNDMADIKGRDLNELFLIGKLKDDMKPNILYDGSKYIVTDDSYRKPTEINVKLSDGTKAVVEASLMFDIDMRSGDANFCGLVF